MGRPVDAFFQGNKLSHPGKLGLVVEGRVLVSILSVPKVLPVHEAQARSEMRLGGLPAGLILNFHARRLADDLQRLGSLKTSVSSNSPRSTFPTSDNPSSAQSSGGRRERK
jgi:hypothetical protein